MFPRRAPLASTRNENGESATSSVRAGDTSAGVLGQRACVSDDLLCATKRPRRRRGETRHRRGQDRVVAGCTAFPSAERVAAAFLGVVRAQERVARATWRGSWRSADGGRVGHVGGMHACRRRVPFPDALPAFGEGVCVALRSDEEAGGGDGRGCRPLAGGVGEEAASGRTSRGPPGLKRCRPGIHRIAVDVEVFPSRSARFCGNRHENVAKSRSQDGLRDGSGRFAGE